MVQHTDRQVFSINILIFLSMKTSAVQIEEFNGVNEFLKTIESRSTNAIFAGHKLSSEAEGDDGWRMTKSYNEASELMATGYKEGLGKLEAAGKSKICASSKVTRTLPQVGIVGFAPHVPNAIAGIPQSMISTIKQTQKSKVINIVYNCGECAVVGADTFIEAGRHLMDLIVALEASGCRVALDLLEITCKNKQKIGCKIRVKDHRQPINPLKLSYMLIHPSFFRRQMFKWMETTPIMTEDYTGGYGTSLKYKISNCSTEGERQYLKENGILSENEFYTGVMEAKNSKTAEELACLMGIKVKMK